MAKAIFSYFQGQSGVDASVYSMEDLKIEDAAPIIKKTWHELMKEKGNVGSTIYDSILTKEITMSKLFMETDLKRQSTVFMDMMDKVICFLDEPSTMDDKLQTLGFVHVDKYQIKAKHFKHFRSAFMKAIKRYLPWTDRRESSWQWFWSKIISAMSLATQEKQANYYPIINEYNGQQLTKEELIQFSQCIHSTFDTTLTTDPKKFASDFYTNLINEQPDIARLFDDKHTSFERQSTRFIAMLNHAIKSLDDVSTFGKRLEVLSIEHVEYGVKIPMLQSFGDILIGQVKQLNIELYQQQEQEKEKEENPEKNSDLTMLKIPKWTPMHDKAWNWFWRVVVGVMTPGMTKKINLNKRKSEMANQDFSAI